MQTEEIRIALGLRPQAEIEYEAFLNLPRVEAALGREEAIKRRYDRTGRTTEMLLYAAAVVLRDQPVHLLAHDDRYAHQLKEKLQTWIRRLGGDPALITAGMIYTNHWKPYRAVVYTDHAARMV